MELIISNMETINDLRSCAYERHSQTDGRSDRVIAMYPAAVL